MSILCGLIGIVMAWVWAGDPESPAELLIGGVIFIALGVIFSVLREEKIADDEEYED